MGVYCQFRFYFLFALTFGGNLGVFAQSNSENAKVFLDKAVEAYSNRFYNEIKSNATKGLSFYFDDSPKDTIYYELLDKWIYGSIYTQAGDTILTHIDSFENRAISFYGKNDYRIPLINEHRANYYYVRGQYDLSLQYYQEGLEKMVALDSPPQSEIIFLRANVAICYSRLYRIDEALSEHFNLLEIYVDQAENGESDEVARTFVAIGGCYFSKGNFEKCTEYNLKAYEMSKRIHKKDSPKMLTCLNNVVIGYHTLEEYDKALQYVDEGIRLGDAVLGKNNDFTFSMLVRKASIYFYQGEVEKAELIHRQAEPMLKGNIHEQYRLEYFSDNGFVKLLKGDYETAVEYLHKAFELNSNGTGRPGIDGVKNSINHSITATRMGNAFKRWYKETNDPAKLDSAIYYHGILLDFYDNVREKNPSIYASGFSDNFQVVIWDIAEGYYLKGKDEMALSLIEKHKAYSTLSEISSEDILFNGVDNEDLRKLEGLQNAILAKEQELYSIGDELSEEYAIVIDSLQFFRKTFEQKLTAIESSNNELYSLKFEPKTFSLVESKTKLNANECIIEYSVSDSLIGIYILTSEGLNATYQPTDSLEAVISNAYNAIIKKEDVSDALKQISEIILKPISEFIGPEISRLIIVPEWYLASFPFELLSLGDNQIFEAYDVSYNNSTLQYLQSKSKNSNGNGRIATFVPDYKTIDTSGFHDNDIPQFAELVRSGYYNLPGAKEESTAILNTLDGKEFTGEQATKSNLFTEAKDYSILHFAMHSEMNKEKPLNSALLFSPDGEESYEKLKAFELYNQAFNADLVVLSACSSGFDRFNKGEGVLGFAKAFAYAGVPSLVYSIWKIPDQSSSYLMTRFYSHLSEGKSKDEALRLAKLDYLNDDAIPSSQKSPYYWAGFIASGNMNPIMIGQGMSTLYWMLGALVLMSGFVYFKKRSHKNAK